MGRFRFPLIWNSPSGQDNDPWRKKVRRDGPPDLEQMFGQWLKSFKRVFSGNGQSDGSGIWGVVILIVIVGLYLAFGVYIVNPPERASITRFGRFVRMEGPGPHWLLPLIESKEVVNVERVSTSEHSGLMLTQDGNIVSVAVAVQYRVGATQQDLQSYLYHVVNPVRSLNLSAESALRQVIGKSTMDEVLTLKRAEIALAVKEQIEQTLKPYQTGIKVLEVVMQYAKAPDEVRAAFDEVIQASADEERIVNQARAYENQVIPKAKGEAEQIKNQARAYKQETILSAEGNAKRFNLILPEYQKSPKVTQTRLYLKTMEDVLTKTTKILIDSGLGNNMIYLPLDRLINEGKLSLQNKNEEAKS